jgi:hypothetical protein
MFKFTGKRDACQGLRWEQSVIVLFIICSLSSTRLSLYRKEMKAQRRKITAPVIQEVD